jgi:photosystem I P700 chlorophyll a apoprotein A1
MAGSCCIAFAHHMYAIPMYPSCASDYPTVLSLFSHHIWVGGILTLGAGAHASIFFIPSFHPSHSFSTYLLHVLKHRDVILGHLLWVSIGLGFHSFSLYIHNDSFQGFGRPEDIFHDNSIQLKPVFALAIMKHTSHFDMQMMLGEKSFYFISQELGTADLIVHHIHAFTIHVALLIFDSHALRAKRYSLCQKF